MQKTSFLLLLAVILGGCTGNGFCGDDICARDEIKWCEEDCGPYQDDVDVSLDGFRSEPHPEDHIIGDGNDLRIIPNIISEGLSDGQTFKINIDVYSLDETQQREEIIDSCGMVVTYRDGQYQNNGCGVDDFPKAGYYEFWITIDPDDKIMETDEKNNAQAIVGFVGKLEIPPPPVEKILIGSDNNRLEIEEDLGDVKPSIRNEGMPFALGDGEFVEREGNHDSDTTFTQTIELFNGEVTLYETEDDDVHVGLLFERGEEIFSYEIKFDEPVQLSSESADAAKQDLRTAELDSILGKEYIIGDVELLNGQMDRLTLLRPIHHIWIAEGETETITIDGVSHQIKMIDITTDESKCGVEVDGSTIWVRIGDTDDINGVFIAALEAKAVNVPNRDKDLCDFVFGGIELRLEDGEEVEINGDEIDGTEVELITGSQSDSIAIWQGFRISYEPDDDIFVEERDSFIEPVFGLEFLFDGLEPTPKDALELISEGEEAKMQFMTASGSLIELPFYNNGFNISLGTGSDPDEQVLVQRQRRIDSCYPESGDVRDCEGIRMLAVGENDAKLVELSDIDIDDATFSLKVLTDDLVLSDIEYFSNRATDVDIPGAGTIQLMIYNHAFVPMRLNNMDTTIPMAYGAGIDFTSAHEFTVHSPNIGGAYEGVTISLGVNSDEGINIDNVDGIDMFGGDVQMGMTKYGMKVGLADDGDAMEIEIPESQAMPEVYLISTP